jgi:hypothetical protein
MQGCGVERQQRGTRGHGTRHVFRPRTPAPVRPRHPPGPGKACFACACHHTAPQVLLVSGAQTPCRLSVLYGRIGCHDDHLPLAWGSALARGEVGFSHREQRALRPFLSLGYLLKMGTHSEYTWGTHSEYTLSGQDYQNRLDSPEVFHRGGAVQFWMPFHRTAYSQACGLTARRRR